ASRGEMGINGLLQYYAAERNQSNALSCIASSPANLPSLEALELLVLGLSFANVSCTMERFDQYESRRPPGPPWRAQYLPDVGSEDRDGRMYEDRSRSRSPEGSSNPRAPHASSRYHDRPREYSRGREPRSDYRDRDQGYDRHWRSRSPYQRGRQPYSDRDHDQYRAPRRHSRPRGELHPGAENTVIMMEGVPRDMTQDDVFEELKAAYAPDIAELEDVRVIRDRQTVVVFTGTSRGIGFLEFRAIEEAKKFMQRHHPYIYLYGPTAGQNDRASRVRIMYSRDRGHPHAKGSGDWTCRMDGAVNRAFRMTCSQCNAPRPGKSSHEARHDHDRLDSKWHPRADMFPASQPWVFPNLHETNRGSNDTDPRNQPSQYIIIRELQPNVDEKLLAKGVAKLCRPASGDSASARETTEGVASTTRDTNLGARQGSLRRVLLVRDRATDESWRYGFAEFASATDAQDAMNRLPSFETFTISSHKVQVNFPHSGVFVPVLVPDRRTEQFTFNPLADKSKHLMYYDDRAYLKEMVVTRPEDDPATEQAKNDNAAGVAQDGQSKKSIDKPKKKKGDATTGASTKKPAGPRLMQFWNSRHAELHGLAQDNENEPEGKPEDLPTQSFADSKRMCCWLCKVGGFSNQRQLTRHEESQVHLEKLKNKDAVAEGTRRLVSLRVIPPARDFPHQSFADPEHYICLLCTRQFQSIEEVTIHEQSSELHVSNLKDEALVAKAMESLKSFGLLKPAPDSEYRDRARERRQAYGTDQGKSNAAQRKPVAPTSEDEAPVQTTSKGASMLSKMGWSEGSGLGAHGTGATAPIATELYAQGVGLGARGSKIGDASEEAARNTRGRPDEFLAKTKENARQRFDEMNR
ncbi:hypothetical protein N7532_001567, partial [Penicillium argentinense]